MKKLALIIVLVSLVTINPQINGWNEASRMALTQSLVENHSFSIEKSTFIETGDKVFIDGHFYSDKPPLPAMLAAVVYWPLYQLGIKLDYGWNLAYYLILLFTVKLLWVGGVLSFYKTLNYFSRDKSLRLWYALIFAFSSLGLTWSATFSSAGMATSVLSIGLMFYFIFAKKGGNSNALLSGLFFGLATAFDAVMGIFFLCFAVLIFLKDRRSILPFLLGVSLPLGVHLTINYSFARTFLPVQFHPQYFLYEGSVWHQGMHMSSIPAALSYGFWSLFGVRGFLWYNPLLFLLIPALIRRMKQGVDNNRESRAIGVAVLMLFIVYALFTQNYGGWGYSIRYLVSVLPFFYIYLGDIHGRLQTQSQRRLFQSLVALSTLLAIVGLINPWSNPEYHQIAFLANLKQFSGFLNGY